MYILYKNPIQLSTLHIVQYCHYNNIHIKPKYCIERNHPKEVKELPTIFDINENKYYSGLDEVIEYYQSKTGKSNEFKKQNPDYHINK